MTQEQTVDETGREAGTPWRVLILMPLLFIAITLAHGFQRQLDDPLGFLVSDDAMRMVQVLDLKAGAGWHDLRQRRLDPPSGVEMHWSRLPDLPLLAALAVTEPLLGRDGAIRAAALLVPPLLGLLFYAAFVWAAAPLVERRWLPAVGLVCLALIIPQKMFMPGAVDHHGWQGILAILGAGGLLRALSERSATGSLIIAGLAGALGLWVGDEAIPPVALVCAALTLGWVLSGNWALHHLVTYGSALAGGVLLVYPLALAPSDWGLAACDAFSLVSLALAGAVLAFGMGLTTLERRIAIEGRLARLSVAVLLAGVLLGALILLFPDCAAGPYGQVSPEAMLLKDITLESEPMLEVLTHRPASAALFLSLPILALLLTGWRLLMSDTAERLVWLGLTILVLGGILLQFWQLRASLLANAYAGLALSWWAVRWVKRAGKARLILTRVMLKTMAILVFPALPILMSLLVGRLSETQVPASSHGCDLTHVLPILDEPLLRAEAPLLIATHINIGPSLLLHTPHAILAAAYHRDTDGLRAMKKIFDGDREQAHAVVEARDVDLIYVCGGKSSFLDRNSDAGRPSFYEQLELGDAPDWLTEIRVPSAAEKDHLYCVVTQ